MNSMELTIRPSSVNLLRFILEGYDNMFILSTIDNLKGLVRIIYVQGMEPELNMILKSMSDKIFDHEN